MKSKPTVSLKLNPLEKAMLETLAAYYRMNQTAVIKFLLREKMEALELENDDMQESTSGLQPITKDDLKNFTPWTGGKPWQGETPQET